MMDMKEKLVELLSEVCTEHVFCSSSGEPVSRYVARAVDDDCVGLVADHLIANGVIVLPCKVGEAIYTIEPRFYNYTKHEGIQRGICRKYELGENDEGQSWNVWAKLDEGELRTLYAYSFSSFGKTVFLTKEAAEKALKEGKK